MNPETLADATAHALATYPREACGLVIVEKGREIYVACRNAAATPSEHFVLPADDYAAAEERGEAIALFHSHPDTNAEPSDADRASCEASGMPWYIASVIRDEGAISVRDVRRIAPCGYEAPLVGRAFAHGVLDCYTLVRDWYRRERGIVLPDFERDDGWWLKGGDLYMQQFEAAGFERIDGPLQVGDGILMQILAPVANHAAVYIGDGQILQHLYGRLSSRDVYGGFYRESTRAVVRYRG